MDEKLIFVLMSFNPQNPSLLDYYQGMKRAVAAYDASLKCINLDEIGGSFKISDTALTKIRQSRLAIVDLTENRPSVYYELGFAHGIGQQCIITAHEKTPQLFYPGEYRILYYKNATDLERKLRRELMGMFGGGKD